MSEPYFGYNKLLAWEVVDMAGLVLLCKIMLIAAACVGAVWFGYWYREHV